jgi:hypothetical protein
MTSIKKRWLPVLGAGILSVSLMSSTADIAHALNVGGLLAALSGDTANSDGYQVVGARSLYRTQDRPWSQIPTGAKLLVRAPAGVTLADVHRTAASAKPSARSPLAVEGAKVDVKRSGDLYELHVTADKRSAALEIQRRAKSL